MNQDTAKQDELRQLRARLEAIEHEVAGIEAGRDWTPKEYYTAYSVLGGMVLGLIGAAASLLFNVVGAALVEGDPLRLIRIYLTFPLGPKALELPAEYAGFFLATGCCLYLGTGMIGGVPFHLILDRYFSSAGFVKRFVVASVLGVGVWLINFYGVLSWLQPKLIGGNWIVEMVPKYVAVTTHLVFGWTVMALGHWGKFQPRASLRETKPS